jgi:hypothetical protein
MNDDLARAIADDEREYREIAANLIREYGIAPLAAMAKAREEIQRRRRERRAERMLNYIKLLELPGH